MSQKSLSTMLLSWFALKISKILSKFPHHWLWILNISLFSREVIFFSCKKSESVVQAMLEGSPDYKTKWDVVRFHMDPKGDRAAKSQTLCSEINEEILGLKFHSSDGDDEHSQPFPDILTITTPSGFIVVFTPMDDFVKKKILR